MKTIARRSYAALPLTLALSLPSAGAAAQPAQAPTRAAAPPPAEAGGGRPSSLDAYLGALVAPRGGLTSAAVAERAGATSFDALARHAEVEAATAAVDQAFVAFLPKVTMALRYTRLSPLDDQELGRVVVAPTSDEGLLPRNALLASTTITVPSFAEQSMLQGTVVVPLSDYVLRLTQSYAAASRSESAARLNEEASRRKAALDGQVAFYGWVRARLQAFVAGRALEQARAHLADLQSAFEAGAASRADMMRVEAQVAGAELVVQRAAGLIEITGAQVRTAIHAPPGQRLTLGEDLRAAPEPGSGGFGDASNLGDASDRGALEALTADARRLRPEIRALDETAWSLKEQGQIARAGLLPRLDALGEVTFANPSQRLFPPKKEFRLTWSAGVQASWTLNDIGTSSAQAAGFNARAAQVEAQKGALADALRLEVTQSLQALRDAEVATGTTARALAAAEESYRARRELFLSGRATSVELTDAETELTRAELEGVSARVDVRVAAARLRHATGRDGVRR